MPLEYSNEEQAICAVGLVTPRLGVFAEAIQQLLVVCTTTEVNWCSMIPPCFILEDMPYAHVTHGEAILGYQTKYVIL